MIRAIDPEQIPDWEHLETLTPLERVRLAPGSCWLETGRLRLFALEEGADLLGRVVAMVNPRMQDQDRPTGLLGCMALGEVALDRRGADLEELCRQAFGWLAGQGMERVYAPMDFSSWYRYRAISMDTDEPRFLGEDPLDARHGAFISRLMTPVGAYASQLIEDVETGQQLARQLRIDRAGEEHGIRLEEMDRDSAGRQLELFYEMASRIFPLDFAFAPIGFEEFEELYGSRIQALPGFYGLLARGPDGELLGLSYGYDDPARKVKTSILKTIGVLPDRQRRGVAWYMTYMYHMNLIERGYRHFIHAMMKEDNFSRAMSSHFARKIRGYSLYQCDL